jgi:hypothetical protein
VVESEQSIEILTNYFTRLKEAFINTCGKVTHCKGCFDKWKDVEGKIEQYWIYDIEEDRACDNCAYRYFCEACGQRHENE